MTRMTTSPLKQRVLVGDFKLAPYVISDPELIVRPMEPTDVALIAASDGLWDVMENEEGDDSQAPTCLLLWKWSFVRFLDSCKQWMHAL